MGFSGTIADASAGQTLTAATVNSWLDLLQAISGAPDSYTPTLSQGASTNIAKTVTYAKSWRLGKLCICSVKLVASAAGTAGSAVTIALPYTAAVTSGIFVIGSGGFYDSGTPANSCMAQVSIESATTFTLVQSTFDKVGVTPSLAVGTSDGIYATFVYELA